MTYDFNLFDVMPAELQRKHAGLLAKFNLNEQAQQKTAMFRDPAAAQALSGASRAVRDCFVDHGFNLLSHDTGTARAETAQDRAGMVARLKAEIHALPTDVDWNGFDVDAFFDAADNHVAQQAAIPAPRPAMRPSQAVAPATPVMSRPLSVPAPA